jgi:Tol biopolymer transport system component
MDHRNLSLACIALLVAPAILAGCKPCPLGPFGGEQNLAEVNSADYDLSPAISADGLTLIFTSDRADGAGGYDLWLASRTSPSGSFGAPENMAELNSPDSDSAPELSADGLTLFFASDRGGGQGDFDLWFATRPDSTSAFGAPENLVEVNTEHTERAPSISSDGETLYFSSDRPSEDPDSGSSDIWVATRDDATSAFGEPVFADGINTVDVESDPEISDDGDTLFFGSDRPDGEGGPDIWYAERTGDASQFGEAANLPGANSAFVDGYPDLSEDGRTLYLASRRSGGAGEMDLWTLTRDCLEE